MNLRSTIKNILFFIFLIGIGMALTSLWIITKGTGSTGMTECFTANGENRQLILKDGTMVYLNAGSVLLYPERFGKGNREVYLSGEAYFVVEADEEHPFLVNTAHLEVTSEASSFLLADYPDNERVFAASVNGEVGLQVKETLSDYYLTSETSVEYDRKNKRIIPLEIDAQKASLFREGYLVFESVSFEHIIKSMERHFNKLINYDSGKYKERHFTVTFLPGVTVEEALHILSKMIPDMQYRISSGTIYIN